MPYEILNQGLIGGRDRDQTPIAVRRPGYGRDDVFTVDPNLINPATKTGYRVPGMWDNPDYYGLTAESKDVVNFLSGQQQPTPNKPQEQGYMPFQINPFQVQNDIALGSGWGGAYGSPMMNPFSMYGSQQPFNWGGYLNTFGGK